MGIKALAAGWWRQHSEGGAGMWGAGVRLHQDRVKNSQAGGWKAARRGDSGKGRPVVDQSHWPVQFKGVCVLEG